MFKSIESIESTNGHLHRTQNTTKKKTQEIKNNRTEANQGSQIKKQPIAPPNSPDIRFLEMKIQSANSEHKPLERKNAGYF